jgi:hypothetical protein
VYPLFYGDVALSTLIFDALAASILATALLRNIVLCRAAQ